jgi:hypothetical protein
VSAAKARHASRPADDDPLARVAAAFDASARLTRSHDQCLARSAAAATRLAMLGIGVDLVIGVRVRPFAAHCWIQTNAWLVNDRHDTVRAYAPHIRKFSSIARSPESGRPLLEASDES